MLEVCNEHHVILCFYAFFSIYVLCKQFVQKPHTLLMAYYDLMGHYTTNFLLIGFQA